MTLKPTSNQGSGGGGSGGIGSSVLIYRYTVGGSDKLSIDTGADTPDAGSNDWTNCDLLEFFLYSRTDESVAVSNINWTFNNDTSSIYDDNLARVIATSLSAVNAVAGASFPIQTTGASVANTATFGTCSAQMQNPTGTVGNKAVIGNWGLTDPGDSAQQTTSPFTVGYRSTTAVTRLKVAPATSGKKLKVGSQLCIYKRLAS